MPKYSQYLLLFWDFSLDCLVIDAKSARIPYGLLASAYYSASQPAVLLGSSWAEEAAQLLLTGSMQNYHFHQQLVVH